MEIKPRLITFELFNELIKSCNSFVIIFIKINIFYCG